MAAADGIPAVEPAKAPAGGAEKEESSEEDAKAPAQPLASAAQLEARATWDTQAQLFLAGLGLSMGLGNFWRIPTLLHDSGGVAFFVPYVVLSLTVAKPVLFMELFLGQFSNQGSVGMWRCVPIGKGIGVCMCIVSLLMSAYFACFMAHAMLFAWNSLTTELPWAVCSDRWGAEAGCYVPRPGVLACKDVTRWFAKRYARANLTSGREVSYEGLVFYVPTRVFDNVSDNCQHGTYTAAELFYLNVLALSDDFTETGNFRIEVLVCIGVCWVVLYPLAAKGVRLAGKAFYVTTAVPYTLLTLLLFHGMSMRDADVGILHLLWPDWRKLLNPRVWYDAMQLGLLSAGISTGVAINMGSFNQFSDDNYLVVIGVAFGELFFGLFSAVAIFSILGSQSRRLSLPVDDLVRPGLGLYFLSFTGAIGDVEYANVSSAALFTVLLLCTLNSNYLLLESVLTPLCDEFPLLRGQRPLLAFFVCLFAFMSSMPMATQNGMYVTYLLDHYVLRAVIPIVSFFEVAFVVGFYGVTRLGLDFKFATHQRLNPYIDLCLRVLAPCALGFTLVFSAVGTEPDLYFESYRYPAVSKLIGWCSAAFGVLQIPLFAYDELYRAEFKFADVCRPKPIWGPDNPAKFEKYLDFLEKHDVKSPVQLSPADRAAKVRVVGTTMGAGDTATAGSPKQGAANEAQGAALPAGAPPVGATVSESQPIHEDVIRRLSTTLGCTPNELRRMETVLSRRLSTMPIIEQGQPAATSGPTNAAKQEKQAKKLSPPSTPPKLEIEPLPPRGNEAGVMGSFIPGYMPVSAMASRTSCVQGALSPLPVWGPVQPLPPEFAGLEPQFASTGPMIPSQISLAPTGNPSAVAGPSMPPAGMPFGSLQRPVLASQLLSANMPLQPPGAVPHPGLPLPPAALEIHDGGIASPLKSALRQSERAVTKGHISINAPKAPAGQGSSGTFGGFVRRQSSIQGPPVVGYSESLRRPSVKLTLLEPIGTAGPEQEKEMQEQVKRAISDFRRKSVAAMRRMSAAPPQFAGPPLPPGLMGPVPVFPRQSISGPAFQPDHLSPRKSISTGSIAPNLASPQFTDVTGNFPPNLVAPRRSISAESFTPNLETAWCSISMGPYPLILSPPRGSSTALSFPPNLGAPRRSVSAGSQQPNLAVARRSISSGSFPMGAISPELAATRTLLPDLATQRRSISAGVFPPGVFGPRRSISAGSFPPGVLGPRRSISAGSFPTDLAAPRRSISGPGFAPGQRRSVSGGPDFRHRRSISGGYPPYLVAPRRSISAEPWRGPDSMRSSSLVSRSSISSRGDRDTSPDMIRLTGAAQPSADKDATGDGDSEDDDEDDDDSSSDGA